MKRLIFFAISVSLAIILCSTSTFAVDLNKSEVRGYGDVNSINVALRLMGGRGSVLRSGTDIRLTYRVTEDAYVIIYNIDSEGYINLLYPHDGKLRKTEKYTVYTLPERGSGVEFKTGGKTGVEYIHALAVRDIRDIDSQELYFLSQNNRFSREKRFRTDMDPYLTMNRIDETLIKDIEDNLPATDQTYFFVNERVDFPDYLCEDGCDDVTIERNFYDQRLEYPYPPLYNIVEIEDDKYYSYDNYYDDNLSNDWDDEVMGYDDTDIHLTLNVGYGGYRYNDPFWGGYYHYDYYHPWYSSFYYDPFYWGWGVGSIGFWWGFHDPWYDYYWLRHRYAYWWNPYPGYYYYPDRWYHQRSRSIYAGRSFRRSHLDYHATLKKVKTRESISRSRLARTRVLTRTARRLDNSRISRALSRRTVRNTRDIRSSSLRKYNPRTRTVYTGNTRRVNRDNPRARGSGSRTSRTIRNLRRKSSSSDRSSDNRSRSVNPDRTRKTSPARRSSTRSSSGKSRSSSARKSSSRSRSSSSGSRSSSTRSRSSSRRSSSASKTRSRSSSGSSRSSSKSSSRSSSRKSSRSSSSKSKRSSGRR